MKLTPADIDAESVKAVRLNGGAWTHYTDSTHDGTFGDSGGILTSDGDDDTVIWIRVGTDTYSRQPFISAIRVDPAA